MRLGIGFIALLLGVALLIYLQADNAVKVTTMSKPAREAADEIAGVSMRDSYEIKPIESNGKVVALELTRVDPRSPLVNMYDIQVGDRIVEIGPFSMRDTDAEMMQAQFAEVGIRQHKLTVLRGAERLHLDNHGSAAQMGGKPGPKATTTPAATPSAP